MWRSLKIGLGKIEWGILSFPMTFGNIEMLSFNEEVCGQNGCVNFPANINNLVIAPCVNIQLLAD